VAYKKNRWPQKSRELQTAIFDSTRWNAFRFRDDDIVVVTWSKAGTTWVQQIIGQLILGAPEVLDTFNVSPWLDMRMIPLDDVYATLEAQTHRRFIKTHLPIDALVFSPDTKYVYVGRDARDILWSAYNHHAGFTQTALDLINDTPGRVGPPLLPAPKDVREYYLHWLEHDELPGFAFSSLWDHVQGWWNARALGNVLLVHFNNLKADMEGEIRRVAGFLGVEIDSAKWPAIVEHCTFDYMREQASKAEMLRVMFKDGGDTFFHKGTNGRWQDVLSPEEIARCDEVAARRLAPDCAHWLKTGELPS
jgi:aryl sulfotransferase